MNVGDVVRPADGCLVLLGDSPQRDAIRAIRGIVEGIELDAGTLERVKVDGKWSPSSGWQIVEENER